MADRSDGKRDGDGGQAQIPSERKDPLLIQPRDISMLCSSPPWLRILTRRSMNIRCVSTRARNLAARHWELARLHSPHPAERHVLDHEATKAAILDYTGLKATTNVVTPSAPKDIYLRGIKIPQKPKPPESDGQFACSRCTPSDKRSQNAACQAVQSASMICTSLRSTITRRKPELFVLNFAKSQFRSTNGQTISKIRRRSAPLLIAQTKRD
ncbi:hypothetical protein ACGC1H_002377 [Rhizoctonia solani]